MTVDDEREGGSKALMTSYFLEFLWRGETEKSRRFQGEGSDVD